MPSSLASKKHYAKMEGMKKLKPLERQLKNNWKIMLFYQYRRSSICFVLQARRRAIGGLADGFALPCPISSASQPAGKKPLQLPDE